jgi:hypothetical protein
MKINEANTLNCKSPSSILKVSIFIIFNFYTILLFVKSFKTKVKVRFELLLRTNTKGKKKEKKKLFCRLVHMCKLIQSSAANFHKRKKKTEENKKGRRKKKQTRKRINKITIPGTPEHF